MSAAADAAIMSQSHFLQLALTNWALYSSHELAPEKGLRSYCISLLHRTRAAVQAALQMSMEEAGAASGEAASSTAAAAASPAAPAGEFFDPRYAPLCADVQCTRCSISKGFLFQIEGCLVCALI
eukprot:TRINITY_DN1697_c0_g1_i3.p2 TRINITY_DN1697_c0_g1~~TRINITY_DN1697_c0_g1_i3.p2  ORF type:complete len:125 (+),score=20.86 TRINITY_DN1697_c0_g1_i3:1135-1509(+)